MGRPVDVVIVNTEMPPQAVLDQYAAEHKHPLPIGAMPPHVEVIEGGFWRRPIARHDRKRLRAAVWAALAGRLLN